MSALTFLFKFQVCNILFGWSVTPMCIGPTSGPHGAAIPLICRCSWSSAFYGKVSGACNGLPFTLSFPSCVFDGLRQWS